MERPVPSGPPPAPVAQRLVIRYAKRGRMRFASHRDIARAVERGVRRAGLPVAYSAGFTPHPKISYSGGVATCAASEAEYLEISLTGACAASDVRDRLDAALPDGIDVIEVLDLAGATDEVALEASQWRVVLPGIEPGDAARAVQAFLAASSAPVERLTSKGIRRLDARSAVLTLEVDRRAGEGPDAGCAILRMVVRHMTPAVRPDDILAALGHVAALAPSSPPLVTRLAQGPIGMAAAAAGVSVPGTPGPAGSPGSAGPAGPTPPAAVAPRPPAPGVAQGQKKATCPGAEAER
jgi:radical SAM-linked protein